MNEREVSAMPRRVLTHISQHWAVVLFFALVFMVAPQWVAAAPQQVVPCPGGAFVSVTMASHFQATDSIAFQKCEFVHEVYLAATLTNVNIVFVQCVFHKGNASIRFDPVGTFANVTLTITNVTVVHWWMVALPAVGTSSNGASMEDTSPLSSSLVMLAGSGTFGLPRVSNLTLRMTGVIWTSACANRTNPSYGAAAEGLQLYFSTGAWRMEDTLVLSNGDMQRWSPSLFYAVGTTTVVQSKLVFDDIQTLALVGSVPAALAALTASSPQLALDAAIDACSGVPLTAHVHVAVFELITTLTSTTMSVTNSSLTFGDPSSFSNSSVLPGGTASVVRVQSFGSTPSSNLFRDITVTISSTNVSIGVAALPRVSLVGNADAPDGVTILWHRRVTIRASSVEFAPLASPLTAQIGGVVVTGPLDGYNRGSLASSWVTIMIVNTTLRVGAASPPPDATSIACGWLDASILQQGADVVAGWIMVMRMPQVAQLNIVVNNSFQEPVGVDSQWVLTVASSMNRTIVHAFYQRVWNDTSPMRTDSAQIGTSTAAGWVLSVYVHGVLFSELGASGLSHMNIAIRNSQSRCDTNCHLVNVTGAVMNAGHRMVGRMGSDPLSSRSVATITNSTISIIMMTFVSRVATACVTLSTYYAMHLPLAVVVGSTAPTAPRASVAHRLVHFAEELIMLPGSGYNTLVVDSSIVSIFDPIASTADRGTVLTQAALQGFIFPPTSTTALRRGSYPSLFQLTGYQLTRFTLQVSNSVIDAGWGHDVLRVFQMDVDPTRVGPFVTSTSLVLWNVTVTHRGWQTRGVAVMSPLGGGNMLNVSSSKIAHLNVTASSGARSVEVRGSMQGPALGSRQLQTLWIGTTLQQSIIPLQLVSIMATTSGFSAPEAFATAVVAYTNLSFGDGDVLFSLTAVAAISVDPVATARSWAAGSLVLVTVASAMPTNASIVSLDAASLVVVQAATSMDILAVGLLADTLILADGAPVTLVRSTIKGLTVGTLFLRGFFTNAQLYVNTISTISAECEVYPDRSAGAALPLWNTKTDGDTLWRLCAAAVFASNTTFAAGSSVYLDSSTLLARLLLVASVTPSCLVVPAALDAILISGTWLSSQIVVRKSSIVVDGRGSTSVPRPTGVIILSTSTAIRLWRPSQSSVSSTIQYTFWNTTSITITTQSSITIDSAFGPAVAFQFAFGTLYRTSLQVNTASVATVTSTSRLSSKAGTVTHYTTGSAQCVNVASQSQTLADVDAQLDGVLRMVLGGNNATSVNGAALLHCGLHCVMAQLEARFDTATLTITAALDPPVPALDMAWWIPSSVRAGNVSIPLPLVQLLVQRRRVSFVHFGTGTSAASAGLNITTALSVAVLVLRSTVVLLGEVQPVAPYGRFNDSVSDVAASIAPLQCRSVAFLLEAPTQLFDVQFRVETSVVRTTVQSAVIPTSTIRSSLADPDTTSTLQRNQIITTTAQLMNITSGSVAGCQHIVNGTYEMSAAWLYIPPKTLARWQTSNPILPLPSVDAQDFSADSLAASVVWNSGVAVLQGPGNASVLLKIIPTLTTSDANALAGAWEIIPGGRPPLNITITSQSTLTAASNTIVEGCSAANIYLQGSSGAPAVDGLLVNISGTSIVKATLYIIPILRTNATYRALNVEEERGCASDAQLYSRNSVTSAKLTNYPSAGSSVFEQEEPQAINLLIHNVTLTSSSISMLDTTLSAVVAPTFTTSTDITMTGAWYYESRFARLSTGPPTNASFMMQRGLPRHAGNVRLDGVYSILNGTAIEIGRSSSATPLTVTARVLTGVDGRAQNLMFGGRGSWRDGTTVWPITPLATLPLVAVGSPRAYPVMQQALLAFTPRRTLLTGNILIDATFNTSNQTVSISGATLTCEGYCANIALGTLLTPTTVAPYQNPYQSTSLGTRVSITGTSFTSQALLSEFQSPTSGVDSTSSLTLTVGSGVFAQSNRMTAYFSIGRLAQTRQLPSHNVMLGSIGPEAQLTIQGSLFVSSGVNIGIVNASLNAVQTSVTSTSGFLSGCWAGPQINTGGTSYAILGRDVPSSVPCLPALPSCPTSNPSSDQRSPDTTDVPSVANVLVCRVNFTRGSAIQIRVLQTSVVKASVVVNTNWSLGDVALIAAKNILVVDSSFAPTSSLTLTPINPLIVSNMQVEASVALISAGSSSNGTTNGTASDVAVQWGLSSSNVELVNVFFNSAKITLGASSMALNSSSTSPSDGVTVGVALAYNVRLVNITMTCTTSPCLPLPSGTTRWDIVSATSTVLTGRGALLGSIFQAGLYANGAQAVVAYAAGTQQSVAVNMLVDSSTLSNAALYLSTALTPVASLSGKPAGLITATSLNGASLAKAINVAIVGATNFVNTSLLMMQGFVTNATTRGGTTTNGESNWPNEDVSAGGTMDVAEWALPSVNVFIGPKVQLTDGRLEFSSVSMTSSAANMQVMAPVASNVTVSVYQSNWTTVSNTTATWNILWEVGTVVTLDGVAINVDQSSRLVAQVAPGGLESSSAFNVAFDAAPFDNARSNCTIPMMSLAVMVTDGSALSAVCASNGTASNVWLNYCLPTTSALAAITNTKATTVSVRSLRNSLLEATVSRSAPLMSNSTPLISVSSAVNVFVFGNASKDALVVDVLVSSSSRLAATGGAVGYSVLLRSPHPSPVVRVSIQASTVDVSALRHGRVLGQHCYQALPGVTVVMNTSLTITSASTVRCIVNGIAINTSATLYFPSNDRLLWPPMTSADSATAHIVQLFTSAAPSMIQAIIIVNISDRSTVMATLQVTDSGPPSRNIAIPGFTVLSQVTSAASLVTAGSEWGALGVQRSSSLVAATVIVSGSSRVFVNNTVATAAALSTSTTGIVGPPLTCEASALNKAVADSFIRAIRYHSAIIDIVDIVVAGSASLARRDVAANVTVDGMSSLASATTLSYTALNQTDVFPPISAGMEAALIRAPRTIFSPTSNLTADALSQIPVMPKAPHVIAAQDTVQVDVAIVAGSLLTVVVSSGTPLSTAHCSRTVAALARAHVWRRSPSIAPGTVAFGTTAELIAVLRDSSTAFVSAQPNVCAASYTWERTQWWVLEGNLTAMRCVISVSNRAAIRVGESKMSSSACSITPLMTALVALEGSDRFPNISLPRQSYNSSNVQRRDATALAATPPFVYSTGVSAVASSIAVNVLGGSSMQVTQDASDSTSAASTSTIIVMADMPEIAGRTTLVVGGQSIIALVSPTSLSDASNAAQLPSALVACQSISSAVTNLTVAIDQSSSVIGYGGPAVIAIQGSTSAKVSNIVLRVLGGSSVVGAWASLLTISVEFIDTAAPILRVSNVSLIIDRAPSLGTFSVGVLELPRTQAAVTFLNANLTQSTFMDSPFDGLSTSIIVATDGTTATAPLLTTMTTPFQIWCDNISIVGFRNLLSTEIATIVTNSPAPTSAVSITVAGGLWSPDATVASGDWPDLFIGLPFVLQQQVTAFYGATIWGGVPIAPRGFVAVTKSSTEALSATTSQNITLTLSSPLSQSTSHSEDRSRSSSTSLTASHEVPSVSITTSKSKPSGTATMTSALRMCPEVEAFTIPLDISDKDIASPEVEKVLMLRFGASARNHSFSWSLDLSQFVAFELVKTSLQRGEASGFTAVLSEPLANASVKNGWVAQDSAFQVMTLTLPTALSYKLIGDETIRILLARDAIAGGCSPMGPLTTEALSSSSIVMSADFTIRADLSLSLQAAAAVVTVVAGSIGLPLAIFSGSTTFVSVFDVQFLALLGQMKCALPDQIRFAQYAVYVLSPFGGLSPQWMALGGAILAISIAILHYLAVFLACFLRRDLPSLMHGRVFLRYPGVSFAVMSLLLAGILSGAFQSTDNADGQAKSSVGQALAGILLCVALMAYLGNLVFRETSSMLDFRPYPAQTDPMLERWTTAVLAPWWVPTGVWMASVPPYSAHLAYTAVVGTFNATSRVVPMVMHVHVILLSIVSGYRFNDSGCAAQFGLLLAIQACFTAFYTLRPPLRIRVINVLLVCSNTAMAASLMANIAYATDPDPRLSNIQGGLQLVVSIIAVVKVALLCVITLLEHRMRPPPMGPPPLEVPRMAPTLNHKVLTGFSSSEEDDDDTGSVDTLGIRRVRPLNVTAASLDDSVSMLNTSTHSVPQSDDDDAPPPRPQPRSLVRLMQQRPTVAFEREQHASADGVFDDEDEVDDDDDL